MVHLGSLNHPINDLIFQCIQSCWTSKPRAIQIGFETPYMIPITRVQLYYHGCKTAHNELLLNQENILH